MEDSSESSFKATVFVEGITTVEYGDAVRATGKVQKYEGDWEVVVNNEHFVEIIQKWDNTSFPLWQLAENPERYVGVNVNITGLVDRVYDTYFYLVDFEEQHSVVVLYGDMPFQNFTGGDSVYVGARFVYDEENFRYVLELTEENHGIYRVESG